MSSSSPLQLLRRRVTDVTLKDGKQIAEAISTHHAYSACADLDMERTPRFNQIELEVDGERVTTVLEYIIRERSGDPVMMLVKALAFELPTGFAFKFREALCIDPATPAALAFYFVLVKEKGTDGESWFPLHYTFVGDSDLQAKIGPLGLYEGEPDQHEQELRREEWF